MALDDALKALAAIDPRQSQVVELRFFGGLSVEETAEVLKVSTRTVMRDWKLAKVWLLRAMNGEKRVAQRGGAATKQVETRLSPRMSMWPQPLFTRPPCTDVKNPCQKKQEFTGLQCRVRAFELCGSSSGQAADFLRGQSLRYPAGIRMNGEKQHETGTVAAR